MPTINPIPQNEMENDPDRIVEHVSSIDYNKEEVHSQTYSSEELNNPQAIDVTISDETTPIVVFFGPPASGKTMTMIRLAKFLTDNGYRVGPVRNFRRDYDTKYQDMCNNFNGWLKPDQYKWAAEKSLGLDFMLLKVFKGSKPIVQILEAPGEDYYNPNDPNEPRERFISYVEKIIAAPNKKNWIFLIEPNWKNVEDCENYVKKIKLVVDKKKRAGDKFILLYNKIDVTSNEIGYGRVDEKGAEKDAGDYYPGLFECFKNQNPITSFWRKYNCTLIPFSTGLYTDILWEGRTAKKFDEGPKEYPQRLWANILKSIGMSQI